MTENIVTYSSLETFFAMIGEKVLVKVEAEDEAEAREKIIKSLSGVARLEGMRAAWEAAGSVVLVALSEVTI